MTTSQMKYFIETVKCLSFTEAAERLYISQPALSRQISAMEAELNVQLFIRSNNTVRLTPAGLALYKGLTRIYNDYHMLLDEVNTINSGVSGTLNIGTLEEQMIDDALHQVLNFFFTRHPNIKINLSMHSFKELVYKLYEGTLDIAVTMEFDIEKYQHISYLPFRHNPLYLVLPKEHGISNMNEVHINQFRELLKDDLFILVSPEDSKYASEIELTLLQSTGFMPRYRYAPSAGLLALWVSAGVGVAILNDNHNLYNNPAVSFVKVIGLTETVQVAAWNSKNRNPVLPLFINKLRDTL